MPRMAMGTRENDQTPLWVATSDLPSSPGHPFYTRLNAILEADGFDRFVEDQCRRFYAPTMGRPSLAPGRYFRLLLIGYFEGIDAERGIAWRAADSLAVRTFLRLGLEEGTPDHSTISRTRRLIDVETHRAVFTWIQQRLVAAGLLKGRTIAIDATTLEANAAMRSIVRRDTGESYQAFLTRLAETSGIKTPTREALARLDRKRKKKTSNKDWTNPHDPDAKVTKMKDGRTHLAHKAEHAVDLETGAIMAVTVQGADEGDTTTIVETAIAAAEQVEEAQGDVNEPQPLEEIIGDTGYHSNQSMVDLEAVGIRSYIAEPDRGRRDWSEEPGRHQPLLDPGKDGPMRLDVDQAARARDRGVVRRPLLQTQPQERPHGQRIGRAPRDAALRIDPFEVPDQQQPKIPAGRQTGLSHGRCIKSPTLVFDKPVKTVGFQDRIQPRVERMPRRGRQIRGRHPQRSLIILARAHGHARHCSTETTLAGLTRQRLSTFTTGS